MVKTNDERGTSCFAQRLLAIVAQPDFGHDLTYAEQLRHRRIP